LGYFQPVLDLIKLLGKYTIVPYPSNKFLYYLGPIFSLTNMLLIWVFLPFSEKGAYIEARASVLFFFALSSLSVYGIIISGWASRNRFALYGSLRYISQVLCYEIILSLLILPVISLSSSINFVEIVDFQRFNH